MRKIFLFIVSVWYIGITAGATINWHYCMGKLRDVAVGETQHASQCGFCGMTEMNGDCCHDEVEISRLSDEHQQQNFNFSALDTDNKPVLPAVPNPVLLLPVVNPALPLPTQPPDTGPPLHVIQCTFRI